MTPLFITSENLSAAWSRVYLDTLNHPGKVASPLIVSISNFDENGAPREDTEVRQNLDKALSEDDAVSVEETAFTIFPQHLWLISQGDRKRLFQMYRDWASITYKESNLRLHGRGLYFERLSSFGDGTADGNQLEWILSQYEHNPSLRRSMLQATTFDPVRDRVPRTQLGFPCLQHLTFLPEAHGLTMNAFYARQQHPYHAYGNLLGLAHLGAFMAKEMDLRFVQLNVIAGMGKLEETAESSGQINALTVAARACVEADGTNMMLKRTVPRCRKWWLRHECSEGQARGSERPRVEAERAIRIGAV